LCLTLFDKRERSLDYRMRTKCQRRQKWRAIAAPRRVTTSIAAVLERAIPSIMPATINFQYYYVVCLPYNANASLCKDIHCIRTVNRSRFVAQHSQRGSILACKRHTADVAVIIVCVQHGNSQLWWSHAKKSQIRGNE
jgi:hypothetical protein